MGFEPARAFVQIAVESDDRSRFAESRDGTASGEELPGEFDVTSVFFVMPGAWEIHIQLKAGSSVEDESILSIQI